MKVLLDSKVSRVEQEDALRGLAVAPGASDLLHVLLERARSVVVQDVADVGLVDAHAEGGGRDHDEAPGPVHELGLRGCAVGCAHLAVIADDWDARACQRVAHLIDRRGRGAVDDAWSAQALDAARGGGELLGTRHDLHGEAQIGAMRGSRQDKGFAQAKPFSDVFADARRGGGGKRKRRRVAQPFPGFAKA